MKLSSIHTLIALLALLIYSSTSVAQEESDHYMGYIIWEDVVFPSGVKAYEEMTKKQMLLYKDESFPHRVDVYSTSDFIYYWVFQVDNYADIDTLYMDFNKIYQHVPDRVNEINDGFVGTHESTLSWTCYFDRELSYKPSEQVQSEDAKPFMSLGFCYPKKGSMDEAREVMKGYVRLATEKKVKLGWDTYIGDMGVETPMLFWASFTKDAGEFYSLNSADFDLMGDRADELWNELISLMRKYEEKSGWYRKDLSYHPAN
jgi:hypothetical protein